MANINTNKKNANVNANNTTKEEKNMAKANEIINSIVNITAAAHANKVTLVKKAGTSYLKLNDFIAGAIGGTQKEQDANIKCIQFMVDNCDENEEGSVLAQQCMMLTCVMANLEKVNLDDVLTLDKVDYVIDTNLKQVYSEGGQLVVDMLEVYPELAEVELTDEAVRAILIGELNKNKVDQIARHEDTSTEEDEINIEAEGKLSVIDTIKGLRALGMKASWFNVNGVKQMMPICYNGEIDLKEFTKIIKEALDNDKDWMEIVMISCKMRENELSLDDETLIINQINCVIDYTKKEIWDENLDNKLASLEDVEYEFPREAVKVMLIERAKAEIERLEAEAEEYDEYDDYCEDCDGCCEDCDYCDECADSYC